MTVVIDGTTGIDTIADNTVTSAKIVDGTIVAADLVGAQTGSAPVYGVRAWCVFDGTLAGTNAPTAGGNVTDVIRNSTGDYTINFTVAFPNANYTMYGAIASNASASSLILHAKSATQYGAASAKTTSAITILATDYTGTVRNVKEIYLMFLG